MSILKAGFRRKTMSFSAIALWACAFSAGVGCQKNNDNQTAVLIRTTLDPEDGTHLDGQIDTLVLRVAYTSTNRGAEAYVVDGASGVTTVSIPGRSLLDDPFEVLIKPDAESTATHIKVVVEAHKQGTLVAWGVLREPDQAAFQSGAIVSRTLFLHGTDSISYPFLETPTGCLVFPDSREIFFGGPNDHDCDGVEVPDDCNDEDAKIGPGMAERCNGLDDNCDGQTDEKVDEDQDGDGFTPCTNDCNDDPNDINAYFINPDASEKCDGLDNNCDGRCDEDFDGDGDGYTSCNENGGSSGLGTHIGFDGQCMGEPNEDDFDCNDLVSEIHPEANEQCDGVENNCDGICDEGSDPDGDGFNSCGSWNGEPTFGDTCMMIDEHVDCKPLNADFHPGRPDFICDGIDHSCGTNRHPWHSESQFCWVDWGSPDDPQCFEGTRTCDDEFGGGWSDCEPNAGAPRMPPEICAEYVECRSENPENPWQTCGPDRLTLDLDYLCTVDWAEDSQTNATICAEHPYYALPDHDNPDQSCQWQLWNFDPSPSWDVYLTSGEPGNAPVDPPISCLGAFLVARPLEPPWSSYPHELVFLVKTESWHVSVYTVEIGLALELTDWDLCVYNGTTSSGMSCELYPP